MGGPLAEQALARMPNLRVIQLLSAGVEPWLPLVPPGVTLCNGRGVHGGSTAELAVGGLLSVLRELPRYHDDQAAHRWSPQPGDDLDGKRVLILGAGDIGRRIAAAVTVFDAQCTFVARTARDDVHGIDELDGLLPEHDIVVISLPHTSDTHHLVGARFLAALPDRAIVVNIARGAIVDQDALLGELQSRRLRAFLDVTDPGAVAGGPSAVGRARARPHPACRRWDVRLAPARVPPGPRADRAVRPRRGTGERRGYRLLRPPPSLFTCGLRGCWCSSVRSCCSSLR